jgi:hypothetical protein
MSDQEWTRKQVLDMADRIVTGSPGYPRAVDVASMLRDLAPPDEPRTWRVGDFLLWNGVPRYIRNESREGAFELVTLVPGHNDLTDWFTPGFFKGAVLMKLVEDKG